VGKPVFKNKFAGKRLFLLISLLLSVFFFSACGPVGNKATSMIIIYGVTTAVSLFVLVAYCCLSQKKDLWMLFLFASVFVVNIGYLSLALSTALEEALLANRISYLGSVFLPMSILMIILNESKLAYKKWVPVLLSGIAIIVFLIAASPGYLDIYYQKVSLELVDGIAVLKKTYGPLHCIYLFYLSAYFLTMLTVIFIVAKRKIASRLYICIFVVAVLINMSVWLLEQLVKFDFEFLSVSYIICELFLLGLHLLFQENKQVPSRPVSQSPVMPEPEIPGPSDSAPLSEEQERQYAFFEASLAELTPTEKLIYGFYTEGKTTKEVLSLLNIKENTLKYHNKNIYSKLGVSSKKQLLEIAKEVKLSKKTHI